MTLEIFSFILYIQTALSAVVALLSLVFIGKREPYIKLIGLLFLLGFLSNLTGIIFVQFKFGNPNIPSSIYDLLLVALASVVYNLITKNKYSKWFTTMSLVFILFAITNLLFFQKTTNASYNKLLSSFIIISYSIFYFYRLMVEMPTTHIHKLPMFWFNSAFLFYHAGSLFLFAFTSYITNVLKDNLLTYWSFHNFLSIIEHFIFIIGMTYDLKGLDSQTKKELAV